MASSSSSDGFGNGGFGGGGFGNGFGFNPFVGGGGQKRGHSEEDIIALLENMEPEAKRRVRERLGLGAESSAVGEAENDGDDVNPYVQQEEGGGEEENVTAAEGDVIVEGDHQATTATQVEVETVVEEQTTENDAPVNTPVIYLLQQPARAATTTRTQRTPQQATAVTQDAAATQRAAPAETHNAGPAQRQGDDPQGNCPLWKALDAMWEKRAGPEVEHFEQAQSFLRGLRNYSRLTNAPHGDNFNFMRLYWDELPEDRIDMLRGRHIVSNYDLENTHNKAVAGREWREYNIGQKCGFARCYFKSKFVSNETEFLRSIPERDRRNVCSCINMVLIDNRKFFTGDHKDRCMMSLERMNVTWKQLVYRVARTIVSQPKAFVQAAYYQADWF